jgi:hypothetical protein
MAKNLISEIAKLLGVELGEEFIIENKDRKETVVLAMDGLHVIQPNDVLSPDHGKLLSKMLQGVYEVKKLPWEPKQGEEYWTIHFGTTVKSHVICYPWIGDKPDFANLRLNMIYRTREEAEAHLAEDYERLTGKKLEG